MLLHLQNNVISSRNLLQVQSFSVTLGVDIRPRGQVFNMYESVLGECKSLLQIVDIHAFAPAFPIQGCVTVLQGAVFVHGFGFRLRHLRAVFCCIVHRRGQPVLEDAAELFAHLCEVGLLAWVG